MIPDGEGAVGEPRFAVDVPRFAAPPGLRRSPASGSRARQAGRVAGIGQRVRLGVIGAAAATVLAQAVSALLCLMYAFGKYPELHLSKQDFRAEVSVYAQHLSQGLPMGLPFSALAIGIIVMQRALVGFDIGQDGIMAVGNPAQNRFGAANKLNNFLMCPMNALSTAIVSFNAQNLGASRQDRIRRGTGKSLLIGLAMYLILGGIGMLLTVRGTYQYLFMSADKITAATIRYGNLYLYVDLSMYFALMILLVFRSGVQGVGHAEFALAAGCAELVARYLFGGERKKPSGND